MELNQPQLKLTVRTLTPELWPDLVDLFGKTGACAQCWCMYWRIGSAYRRRPGTQNRAAFRKIVEKGPPPGLIAFEGGLAVGWCQITPRDSLPWLEREWRLKRVDEVPVWSISCFYIRKGFRKRGIATVMIEAAIEHATRAGALVLEAYPLDATLTPSASSTGHLTTFKRLGFKIVGRHTPPRPIMRLDLKSRKKRKDSSLVLAHRLGWTVES